MDSDSLFDRIKKLNMEMESHFYSLFSPKHPLQSISQEKWHPYTDVYETKDALVIKMELAGVKKEDLSVRLYQDRLMIRGMRKDFPPGEKRIYYQMEINYSEFERAIILPESLGKVDVKAEYKDGFLMITLSKDPDRVREKTLQVGVL